MPRQGRPLPRPFWSRRRGRCSFSLPPTASSPSSPPPGGAWARARPSCASPIFSLSKAGRSSRAGWSGLCRRRGSSLCACSVGVLTGPPGWMPSPPPAPSMARALPSCRATTAKTKSSPLSPRQAKTLAAACSPTAIKAGPATPPTCSVTAPFSLSSRTKSRRRRALFCPPPSTGRGKGLSARRRSPASGASAGKRGRRARRARRARCAMRAGRRLRSPLSSSIALSSLPERRSRWTHLSRPSKPRGCALCRSSCRACATPPPAASWMSSPAASGPMSCSTPPVSRWHGPARSRCPRSPQPPSAPSPALGPSFRSPSPGSRSKSGPPLPPACRRASWR